MQLKSLDRDACKNPHLHFALAIEPDGTIYSWSYVGNYSEPETVWNGTDLCIYGASDETSSYHDAYIEGIDSDRDAYSLYLEDGETIPDDIDDADIYDYLNRHYPHCLAELDEEAINWSVEEGLNGRIDALDSLIAEHKTI